MKYRCSRWHSPGKAEEGTRERNSRQIPLTACIFIIMLSSSRTCASPSSPPLSPSFCSSPLSAFCLSIRAVLSSGTSKSTLLTSESRPALKRGSLNSESPLESPESWGSAVEDHSFASSASRRRGSPVFSVILGQRVLFLQRFFFCRNQSGVEWIEISRHIGRPIPHFFRYFLKIGCLATDIKIIIKNKRIPYIRTSELIPFLFPSKLPIDPLPTPTPAAQILPLFGRDF